MKETLKSYAFPPLLLSSLQMVLKVILKIACKATKPSKYLNNTMQFIFFFLHSILNAHHKMLHRNASPKAEENRKSTFEA